MSPPLVRVRHDEPDDENLAVFTNMLIGALTDERVSRVLHTYWTKAVKQSAEETNAKIQALEREVEDTHSKLTSANAAIDELEQYSRRNALRIWFPQPEIQGEDTDKLVLDFAKEIEVDLQPTEIGRSHRVGPPNKNRTKPRAVIVKFTTYNTRRRLYEARMKSADVFISEDLTQQRSRLYYNARLERRAGRFQHVWSRDGRIHVRLYDNSVKVITTLAQLDDVVDQTPMPDPNLGTPPPRLFPGGPQPTFADAVRSPTADD